MRYSAQYQIRRDVPKAQWSGSIIFILNHSSRKENGMPYYVYKIQPLIKVLEKVQQFGSFKDASKFAKDLRASLASTDNCAVKVIFGENELEAEDTLSQVRDPQPLTGEDY